MLQKMLTELINQYLSYSDEQIETVLFFCGIEIKQRVFKIDDLRIEIYSNDHTPPHFHVI